MRDMPGRPVFSVVIDTYNYGGFIGEALDSVIGQDFPQEDVEIIVVDDGSTDDTAERVAKYGGRVSYLYKENGGQASALNAGVERARGEIIAFLDSDDYWHPAKLKEVHAEFIKSDEMDFVYHYMDVVDNKHSLVDRYIFPDPAPGQKDRGDYLKRYLAGSTPWFSPMSGMSVRRSCLEKIMPLPEDFRIAADIHLHYVLPFYVRWLSLVKKPLGRYRLHGGNLSGGNLLTPEKLRREQGIILLNRKYVERHAEKLGLDCHLLATRLTSIAAAYDIYILSARGHRLAALGRAVLFDGFLPADSFGRRLAGKAALCISSVISPSLHLRLQRIYRRIWYHFVT